MERVFSSAIEPRSSVQQLFDYIQGLKRIPNHAKQQILVLVRRLIEVDELTRCIRQEYFWHSVHQAMLNANTERRHYDRRSDWIVLWVIDIAHFKSVNDTLGHRVGDLVLRLFGRILRSSIRHRQGVDIAGRVGGDEFAVLLTEVSDVARILKIGQRFRERVEKRNWGIIHPDLKGERFPRPDLGIVCLAVSSIEGIAELEEISSVANLCFQKADGLMYLSKKHGDIFLRCVKYDRIARELHEVDAQIYRLSLKLEEDRRHL